MPQVAIDALGAWIREQAAGRKRYVFGIAGPPGSGKSTVAARVGAGLGAPIVPMDGFHLRNAVLDERGLRGQKGSPLTFDSRAFVDAVATLTTDDDADILLPTFDRVSDEPCPDRVRIGPTDRIVLVEGNYLLLDDPPWVELDHWIDAVAYLDVDRAVRVQRLVARHVHYGRSLDDANAFVHGSDERNTEVVEAVRHRAHLVISDTGR